MFLLVGAGGALGALIRYYVAKLAARKTDQKIPLGTTLVNIAGALGLGITVGLGIDGTWYWLIGEGFFGALTTFSTLMFEGYKLLEDRETTTGIAYLATNLFIGVFVFLTGYLFSANNLGGL
jgi:CrcB protein